MTIEALKRSVRKEEKYHTYDGNVWLQSKYRFDANSKR